MQNTRVCRHPAEKQSPDSTDERTSVNGYRDMGVFVLLLLLIFLLFFLFPLLLPFSTASSLSFTFFYFILRLANHPLNSRIGLLS